MKAFDILDHAIHSAPHNPDLLVEMGDKKLQNNDAVEADRYFSRAIQLDPNHGRAIQLRTKTRDLAIQYDNIKLAQLSAKRNLLRSVFEIYVGFPPTHQLSTHIFLKIFIREYHSKELKTNYKLMKILNEQYYQPGFPTLPLVHR